jgi:hypothetical protein
MRVQSPALNSPRWLMLGKDRIPVTGRDRANSRCSAVVARTLQGLEVGIRSPSPEEFQSPVRAETIAITAGIAAASIMMHGIAAHMSSVAKLCRKAVGAVGVRRVVQMETNIAANTLTTTSVHIPITTHRRR